MTSVVEHCLSSRKLWFRWLLLGAVLLLLWVVRETTPLKEYLSIEYLEHLSARLDQLRYPLLAVVLAYVVGSFLLFPITAMILLTALTLSPSQAMLAGMIGVAAGGCVGFFAGRLLGEHRLERYLGEPICRAKRHIHRNTFISVLIIRHLPLGPFTFVNLVLGCLNVPLHNFVLGSVISLTPTLLLAVLFGQSIR